MRSLHDIYPTETEPTLTEKTAEQLTLTMEQYVADPDIQDLIIKTATLRGIDVPPVLEGEEAVMAAAQAALDFRNGGGREAMQTIELDDSTRDTLGIVVDKLDMKRNTVPALQRVAVGLVPGSAGIVPRKRLDYLVELMDAGLEADAIALIGCERPVFMKPDAQGQTELDRAKNGGFSQSGIPAKTEFDILRNSAADKFDIPDDQWDTYKGTDLRVPSTMESFQDTWRIAYAEASNGKPIFVISAAMIGENRYHPTGHARNRSNTADGFMMVAEMLKDTGSNTPMATLVVTDAVFNRFQGADAVKALAPYGIQNETVGFTREHAGLPDWPNGDVTYIQEVLSTLRQTRAARDALSQKV